MRRVQPPDTLLITLLRRSGSPSDANVNLLRYSVFHKLIDTHQSSASSLVIQQAISIECVRLLNTWATALSFLRTLTHLSILLTWRMLTKARALSSGPSIQ